MKSGYIYFWSRFLKHCTQNESIFRDLAVPKGAFMSKTSNKVKRYAEFLGDIINDINPPEDGEYNKAVYIMSLARAYVNYLDDSHHNNRFLNPGSFALICQLIARNVI